MLRSLRLCATLSAASLLILPPALRAQDAAINATGAAANASAILDLDVSSGVFATKRGLMIPRMTEAQRIGIVAPANGLWVYQTNDATGVHGLWYYDAGIPAWVRLPGGVGWDITGNAGTSAGVHYLGTADATDLVLRTFGTPWMQFSAAGPIGINTALPNEALHVDGGMRLYAPGANNLTTQAGVIRFNTTPPAGTTNQYHEGNTTGTAAGWGRLENAERPVFGANYTGSTLACGNGAAISPTNSTSTNQTNTAFPTGPGGRNAKVQYLYRGTEMASYGLCPGNITEIALRVVLDDFPQIPIILEASMETTALTDLSTGYNAAISAATPRYSIGAPGAPVGQGFYQIPLSPPYFWNGTDNVMIELCWTRNTTPGSSPPIELNNAGYPATWYGYDNFNNIGCAMDATNPLTAVRGILNTRAVIRFTGQAMVSVPVPALGDYLQYEGGLMVESNANWASTAGNFKGPGTISAEIGVYDGNTQLSDHVFDRYFDGAVKPEDRAAASRYNYVELDRLKNHLAENRHLPSMPSREEFETRGKPSLGELGTRLWETVETQAIYIAELEKDLSILEEMAFDRSLTDAELAGLIGRVNDNPRLTPEQKDDLVATIRQRNDRSNQH